VEDVVRERIDFGDPALAEALRALDPARLRSVAAVAARIAVDHTGLSDPRLIGALAALHAGEPASSEDREAVATVIGEFDEVYWSLAHKRDAATPASNAEHESFARARAANALWYALDPDPHTAALEAVYESLTALDGHTDKLRTALRALAADQP